MVSEHLVITTVVVEGLILVLLVAFFFGHGFWTWRRRTRSEPLVAGAREALAAALNTSEGSAAERIKAGQRALEGLGARLQIRLLVELARSLSGAQKLAVKDLAERAGVIARAERRLHSRSWWRRLHAARLLTVLGAGQDSMPRLLQDRRAMVRAQAAEWAADHPSPETIGALLNLLTDSSKLCRFTAQNSLLRMGGAVVPALADYLSGHSGVEAEAAMEVATGLAGPAFAAPALRLGREPMPGPRALAARLLGQLGGPDGVAVIMDLLADADSGVRAAAARSLGDLKHWPAAPALARALRDPVWDVRREAGLALRALGSPGTLLLRRFLSDQDAFAADMARQVLDIPESAAARHAS